MTRWPRTAAALAAFDAAGDRLDAIEGHDPEALEEWLAARRAVRDAWADDFEERGDIVSARAVRESDRDGWWATREARRALHRESLSASIHSSNGLPRLSPMNTLNTGDIVDDQHGRRFLLLGPHQHGWWPAFDIEAKKKTNIPVDPELELIA